MAMNRRHFLQFAGGSGLALLMPASALAANLTNPANPYQRLLILVELKGGNDGLNTLVPYADPNYARLRPTIGLARDSVLPLSEQAGLHPALESLLPLWRDGRLAVLQGVGYPQPNLSHFRSIDIWDTASASSDYLEAGWLARTFATAPPPLSFAADAVALGSSDMGPLAGGRRMVVLGGGGNAGGGDMTAKFSRQARSLGEAGSADSKELPAALRHVQGVEGDVRRAGERLVSADSGLRTTFPDGNFGRTVRAGCEVLAGQVGQGGQGGVAALRLTLSGFDTHQNQPGIHEGLLRQLGEGLTALRAGLEELGLWQKTLVLTYAEFGRRAAENRSRGTDHGTASVHFAMGGGVRGGLFGQAPRLDQLDGNGNLSFAVDFRSVYATVLERWWQMESREVLRGRFPTLNFLA